MGACPQADHLYSRNEASYALFKGAVSSQKVMIPSQGCTATTRAPLWENLEQLLRCHACERSWVKSSTLAMQRKPLS